MKKYFIPGLISLAILVVIGGVFLFSKKEEPKTLGLPSSYEYFWGDGCPHCAVVAEFLDSWDKKDKIQIDKKEVWKNSENATLLNERAKYCNIRPSEVGVPFLFTPEGKCINGDTPIIQFLKELN